MNDTKNLSGMAVFELAWQCQAGDERHKQVLSRWKAAGMELKEEQAHTRALNRRVDERRWSNGDDVDGQAAERIVVDFTR